MAAAALIVVIFSAADSTQSELLQLQDLSAGEGGGYALPPGYEGSGAESRDHSRWWEHNSPSSAPSPHRKPASPKAPSPSESPKRVNTAALPASMLEAMDTSIDPCEDFYTYSCGKWDAAATIPDDKTSWLRSWDIPSERIETEMKLAMEEDKGIVGTFYQSCMNEVAIDKLGNEPLQPMLKKVEEVKDMKSLTNMLVWMGNRDNGALFGWGVSPDSENPESRAFYMSPGGMTLPDQSYYLENAPEMKEHRAIEKGIIEKLLVNAGVSEEQARKDALNCLAIETRTAEITMKREEARGAVGKRITRKQLKETVPLFHWDTFFEGIGMHDVGLEGGPQLIMRDDKFFDKFDNILTNPNPAYAKLSSLVGSDAEWEVAGLDYEPAEKADGVFDEADAEVIKSYLRYTLVSSYATYLAPTEFAEVLKPLFTDLYGIKERPVRWKKCYHSTNSVMAGHVSKLYVQKFFPDENRQTALRMLGEIRDQFKADLKDVPWMDDSTRPKAVQKLDDMVFEVGYPTEWPEWCEMDGLRTDSFMANYQKTEECRAAKQRKKLYEKVKRREWQYAGSTDVNAYYSQKVNGLFIPAAVLDKPFFSPDFDEARNYGSIGAVLGHEMTHGFDDQGRKFDNTGKRSEWWDTNTVDGFTKKAQCISDQFSGYTIHGDKKVSGELTLGEDIADSGGLKMAHHAWQKAAVRERSAEEERLFFLSFAQTWCGVERKKAEETQLFDSHAPRRWRVMGTLSNSEGFQKAFQCPNGSVMNRGSDRCQLW